MDATGITPADRKFRNRGAPATSLALTKVRATEVAALIALCASMFHVSLVWRETLLKRCSWHVPRVMTTVLAIAKGMWTRCPHGRRGVASDLFEDCCTWMGQVRHWASEKKGRRES